MQKKRGLINRICTLHAGDADPMLQTLIGDIAYTFNTNMDLKNQCLMNPKLPLKHETMPFG